MTFLREVTIDHLTPEMLSLEVQGDLTLIWHDDSIEVWANIARS